MAEGCVESFAGFDGMIGYVPETDCAVTPDVTPGTEYDDSDGTKRFWSFGLVENATPNFNPNNSTKRGVGGRTINCINHGRYESMLSISYWPTNMNRIAYMIGSATERLNYLPSNSIELVWNRVAPNAKERHFLFNGCKTVSWTIECSLDESVKFSEEVVGVYMEPSDTVTYADYQSVVVGAMPLKPDCGVLMFYEGAIKITRRIQNEDVSSQFTGSESSCDVVNDPMNWALSEADPTDAQVTDITVTVDGTPATVTDITDNTITLSAPPGGATTVLVTYHYIDKFINASAYTIAGNNNTLGRYHLDNGLSVPGEIRVQGFDVTGSLTLNFTGIEQFTQLYNNEDFHVFIELGQLKLVCPTYAKWNSGTPPPLTEADLIDESLDYTAKDIKMFDVPAGW